MSDLESRFVPKIPLISEEILQQGIRATLDVLQKNIPRENIAAAVTGLRGHSETALSDLESRKKIVELYAIAGHFSEHVWEKISAWHKDHPAEIGTLTGPAENRVFSTIPHQVIREMFQRDPQDGFERLRTFASDTMTHLKTQYFRELFEILKKSETRESDQSFEVRALHRYVSVFKDLEGRLKQFGGNPEQHIGAGLNTAYVVSWQTIQSLPAAFEDVHKRVPTEQEYDQLLQAARNLVLYLSTLEISVFTRVLSSLYPQKQSPSGVKTSPNMLGLIIKEDAQGRIAVDIHPKALKTLAANVTLQLEKKDWKEKPVLM